MAAVMTATLVIPTGRAGSLITKDIVENVAEKGIIEASENGVTKKGWKLGESISNLTDKGKVPSWGTVRARFWKNEALYNGSVYSKPNLARMRRGLAPQRINPITKTIESMELHHTPIPQRNGGLLQFIKVWPDEHKAIDIFRH